MYKKGVRNVNRDSNFAKIYKINFNFCRLNFAVTPVELAIRLPEFFISCENANT